MDSLIWKIKQLFRQILPLAIVGALIWGGYNMYKAGALRRGIGPAFTATLHKIPYFGSRFRHYTGGSSSYSKYGKSSSRRGKHYRRSRRGRRR